MRWQRAFHVSPILLTVLVSESLIISCTKQLEEKSFVQRVRLRIV